MKKRVLSLLLCAALLLPCSVWLSGCGESYDVTLNVYNWGEYMSLGEDGALHVNKAFEQWYYEQTGVKVKVNYTTYDSNESLRSKLETGAVSYDVIVPSDYMIAWLIEQDLLLELNYDNIPNYQYIEEDFRGLFYDPENKYTVPYTYGMVGILYDANKVAESDTGSWDLLWNETYSGDILQFNNSRDAFGSAMYKLGLDVNTTNAADWQKALAELKTQKPLVKSYVMDEIFNMMESGEAAAAAYYAGDYFTMKENAAEDVDLRFYYPKDETGNYRTNLFVDAMCIPKGCQNQEIAEAYINFMLSEEAAIANAEYIYYASPNSLVYNSESYKEDIGEEAYSVLYPEDFDFHSNYETFAYRNLDTETLTLLGQLWEDLKID